MHTNNNDNHIIDTSGVEVRSKLVQNNNVYISERCQSYSCKNSLGNKSEKKRQYKSESSFEEMVSAEKRRQRFSRKMTLHNLEVSVEDSVSSYMTLSEKVFNRVPCSRKRLTVQRSLSVPDVVQSNSPVFKDFPISSPDIINDTVDYRLVPRFPSESHVPKVYILNADGNTESSNISNKVRSYNRDVQNCVSEQGQIRRHQLRQKKWSSGYWTGSSNDSISVDMVNQSCDITEEKQSPPVPENTPLISIFTQNSNGSLYVNEDVFQQLVNYNISGVNPQTPQESESISPLSQFCYAKLQEAVNLPVTQTLVPQISLASIRKEEGQLKNELYQHQFEQCMMSKTVSDCDKMFYFSDSTTPSSYKCHCGEKTIDKTTQVKPNFLHPDIQHTKEPSSSELFADGQFKKDPILVDSIERASRCTDDNCNDVKCRQMKSVIDELRHCVNERTAPRSAHLHHVLLALKYHSQTCEEMCQVPWCRILSSMNDWSISKAIVEIYDKESSLTGYKSTANCVKIKPCYQVRYCKSDIIEGLHWFTLMPLNNKKSVVIAEEVQKMDPEIRWTIKKTCLNDYDQQLKVYEKLREFTSPYIVDHYWAAECEQYLLTCTQFKYGSPLSYLLCKRKVEERDIIQWMFQVSTGVMHLHKYNIIFLKWASQNMVLDGKGCVQICDLSCSVLSTNRQSEYSEVKRSLPSTIFPPELDLMAPEITEKSDSWGCGCLLYELYSSYPVFHHLRHEHHKNIWKEISASSMPRLPVGEFQDILDVCWKRDPEKRESLPEIIKRLLSQCERV